MIGIRTYVGAFLWAGTIVLQAYLSTKAIAMIILAFCVGAALHAFVIRFGVWLFSRKCVSVEWIGSRGGRRLFWLGVIATGVWYLVASIRAGSSTLHTVAIEAAYVSGVFLYERPNAVKRELQRRLAPCPGRRTGNA